MNFYEVAILNTPSIFTYFSKKSFNIGDVIIVDVRGYKKEGLIVKQVKKPNFECKEIIEQIYSFSEIETKFINFISKYYFYSIGQSAGLFYFKNMKKKLFPISVSSDNSLSSKQQEALSFIQSNRVSILFGDTGSGKTEIYIKLIEKVLNQNKQILYLLPEIVITSQIEERIKSHFGDVVGVWHSKINKTIKNSLLERMYQGDKRVIIGTMSSLFLPFKDLGAIIVDEFHEDSFKLSHLPFYNAKDLAIYLGNLYNAKVVLGSATPLVSDLYKFPSFRLKGNFFHTIKKKYYVNFFDKKITKKIKEKKQQKKQTIIFIPTKANYKTTFCLECGNSIKCPNCNISLSLYKKTNTMKCNYCNYTEPINTKCKYCNSTNFSHNRIGTKELQEILKKEIPELNIEIFDKDTITSKTKIDKILKKFKNKEIDVLIGTQMISKGLDFPDVTLAIILDIDYLLNDIGYKSNEKAFSLVKQVEGRAGRKENAEIIIQTSNVEFFNRNFEEFYQEEIEFRKDFNYPPFSKLAKIEFIDKDKNKAFQHMKDFLNCIGQIKEIVGYGESTLPKIGNKYYFNVILKGEKLHNIIYPCYKEKKMRVNIDPLDI